MPKLGHYSKTTGEPEMRQPAKRGEEVKVSMHWQQKPEKKITGSANVPWAPTSPNAKLNRGGT